MLFASRLTASARLGFRAAVLRMTCLDECERHGFQLEFVAAVQRVEERRWHRRVGPVCREKSRFGAWTKRRFGKQ